jgi:putative transcriptional regulator
MTDTVALPDVRAIRAGLRLSQERFAARYRIPIATLKNWEQGRRCPDAPAIAYLTAISNQPEAVFQALQGPPRNV